MKELIYSVFGSWFGANNALSQLKTEHKYKDAKDNLPILLEILNDLQILQQAFINKGIFCPLIEHRCPNISSIDGDGINKFSYAQRSHQFRMIGNRLIANCRKIIYLTPKDYLPQVLLTCKEIKDYLVFKHSADQKTFLDCMIQKLNSSMSEKIKDNVQEKRDADINFFVEKLAYFYAILDNKIEKELPDLAKGKQFWLNNRSYWYIFIILVLLYLNLSLNEAFNRIAELELQLINVNK